MPPNVTEIHKSLEYLTATDSLSAFLQKLIDAFNLLFYLFYI